MKPRTSTLIILLFLTALCGCKTHRNCQQFLNYVKNEEYDKAKSLMNSGIERTFGADGLDYRLKNAHELIAKYGIPPENKWEIKYDTAKEKGIFRMIEITIPIYEAKGTISSGELESGSILLDYIYKMPYFGDSIFSFDTHIRKKW